MIMPVCSDLLKVSYHEAATLAQINLKVSYFATTSFAVRAIFPDVSL